VVLAAVSPDFLVTLSSSAIEKSQEVNLTISIPYGTNITLEVNFGNGNSHVKDFYGEGLTTTVSDRYIVCIFSALKDDISAWGAYLKRNNPNRWG